MFGVRFVIVDGHDIVEVNHRVKAFASRELSLIPPSGDRLLVSLPIKYRYVLNRPYGRMSLQVCRCCRSPGRSVRPPV